MSEMDRGDTQEDELEGSEDGGEGSGSASGVSALWPSPSMYNNKSDDRYIHQPYPACCVVLTQSTAPHHHLFLAISPPSGHLLTSTKPLLQQQPRLESRGRAPSTTLPPSRAREVQRAFRARRAVHLAKLEDRVLLLESENALLRAQLALPPAERTVLGTGPTGKGKSLKEGGVPMSERVRAKRERDKKRGIKRSPEPVEILEGPSAKLARVVKTMGPNAVNPVAVSNVLAGNGLSPLAGGGDGVAGPSSRTRLPSHSTSDSGAGLSPSLSPALTSAQRSGFPEFPDFTSLLQAQGLLPPASPAGGVLSPQSASNIPQPQQHQHQQPLHSQSQIPNQPQQSQFSWSDFGMPTPVSPITPPQQAVSTDQSFALLMGMLTRHPEFLRRVGGGGNGMGMGGQGQGQGQGQSQSPASTQYQSPDAWGGMGMDFMGLNTGFGQQPQQNQNQHQNQNQNHSHNLNQSQSVGGTPDSLFGLLDGTSMGDHRPSSAPIPSYHQHLQQQNNGSNPGGDIMSPSFPEGMELLAGMSRAPMGLRLQPPNFGEVNGNGKRGNEAAASGSGAGSTTAKRRAGGDGMPPPPVPSTQPSPSTSNSSLPNNSTSTDLLSRLRFCCNLSTPSPSDPGLMVFASRLVLLLDCPFGCSHPPASSMEGGWVSLVVAWTGLRVFLENNGQSQGGGLGMGRLGAEMVLKKVKERMEADGGAGGGVGRWLGCRREGGFGVEGGLFMELVGGGGEGGRGMDMS